MPAPIGTLPTSNTAGNNQTSPGVGGTMPPATPIFQPMQGAGQVPSSNPYLGATATSSATGTSPGAPAAPLGGSNVGLYNQANSYGAGQTDINKQLTDVFGKGIGGSLNKELSSLSGVDSQVFQQWLAGQVPAQAQAEATMRQGLGAMGVSGNSSVAGLAEANLGAQFNATAAQENANLMQQNIGTTTSILQGSQQAAAAEVAQSPLSIASQVIGDVGTLAGAVTGLGGLSKAASSIPQMFVGGAGTLGGLLDQATPGINTFSDLGQGSPDLSAFGSYGQSSVSFDPTGTT